MSQVSGRVYIAMNGARLRSKEGATLNIGGPERKPAISDSGVDGFVENLTAPMVECRVHHTADMSLAELQSFRDGTLTFETDTGRIYTLINAWCSDPPKLEKGEVSLKFEAMECIEG